MPGGTQEATPIALPRIPITFPPYSTLGLGESHKWLLPASRHYVVPCGLKIILLLNSSEIIQFVRAICFLWYRMKEKFDIEQFTDSDP